MFTAINLSTHGLTQSHLPLTGVSLLQARDSWKCNDPFKNLWEKSVCTFPSVPSQKAGRNPRAIMGWGEVQAVPLQWQIITVTLMLKTYLFVNHSPHYISCHFSSLLKPKLHESFSFYISKLCDCCKQLAKVKPKIWERGKWKYLNVFLPLISNTGQGENTEYFPIFYSHKGWKSLLFSTFSFS